MKNIAFICFFLGLSTFSYGQSKDLFKPMGKGNTTALSELMNDEVEFCINSGQKNISKAEAISALNEFLTKVQPKSARKMHYGDSKVPGSYFQVGKLKTSSGNYRVFIYFENDKIVELRIDDY